MKDKVVEVLANLLKVKSVLTLALTAIVAVLALRGDISGDKVLTIYTTVIAFYFGTQSTKGDKQTEAEPESSGAEFWNARDKSDESGI